MKNLIQWTARLPDGVKREVRVTVRRQHLKWQFKRSDEERWDYVSPPTAEDWDRLEDVLRRRAGRGRSVEMIDDVRKLREKNEMHETVHD
ncbi:MAG: hypothetical protein KJ726_08285 [Verrucomicrobia bacterium]|nr:hypothetical protein [Verrucomicrobiota bacterium]